MEIFQTQTRLRCTQPFIQYRPNIEIMLKCERDAKSSQIFYLSIELKQGCYKILTIFESRRSERTHILHWAKSQPSTATVSLTVTYIPYIIWRSLAVFYFSLHGHTNCNHRQVHTSSVMIIGQSCVQILS